jgi:dolichyl-phosphate beta-glucosyltransferase
MVRATQTRLSVVIPALDEALRLPATLDLVGSFLSRETELLPAQVVVVDDGSSDGTEDVARAWQSPPEVVITVHRHPLNRGKGAATRTGFSLATGTEILLSDADLATPIEEIHTLRAARTERSVVIGSRAVDRRLITVPQPLYRDLMGRTFNLAEQLLAVRGIADTQCGFKLFPGDLGRSLAAVQRIDGFAFDVELLLVAKSWGYEVHEVGVEWHHVEASRVRPVRHSAQMLGDLLRLGWWRLSGRLPLPPAELQPPDAAGAP